VLACPAVLAGSRAGTKAKRAVLFPQTRHAGCSGPARNKFGPNQAGPGRAVPVRFRAQAVPGRPDGQDTGYARWALVLTDLENVFMGHILGSFIW
jgi:hypothetical protein